MMMHRIGLRRIVSKTLKAPRHLPSSLASASHVRQATTLKSKDLLPSCSTAIRCFSSADEDNKTAAAPKIEKETVDPIVVGEEEKSATDPVAEEKSESLETKMKNTEKIEFKAETKQILDIMTHSLYTDKEVFVRELVSNASDALEKLRHAQVANTTQVIEEDMPLEIRIDIDEVASSITISDTGIGMTKDEMIDNLGTIARSGSRKFVEEVQRVTEGGEADMDKGIIGKFGVGFYSVFMVADKVEVISKSALKENSDKPTNVWTSDGGAFEMGELDADVRQQRGTSIKIYLSTEFWEFCDEKRLQDILNRYSNFVGFPIYLMGKKLNKVDAIWTKDPKEVEQEDYWKFYRYISNGIDDPLDTYHFRADAPLDIKALFFIPSFHTEKYGAGRMEPAVNLYCRKVLIEAKSPDILPEWLRFLKGVVDSEDLPLAISREKVQDSKLIEKLRAVLTRKFIAHLAKMAKNDKETYIEEFYKEYSHFLKEGVCQDFEFQKQLSKLLYFESNKNTEKTLVSLDEYIANMKPEQKEIYYLVAATREGALNSPYMETFKKTGVEVLFVFNAIDDFVMGNLKEYEGRALVSVEQGDIDLKDIAKTSEDETNDDDIYKADRELSIQERVELCNWFKENFKGKLASCTITDRLSSSPAIVTDHESGALRRMMRMVDTTEASRDVVALPEQHLELNPSHKVIRGIYELKDKQPTLAKTLASQVFDNCLVAAGLLDDSRSMLPRLNDLLVCVVSGASQNNNPSAFAQPLEPNEAPIMKDTAVPSDDASDSDSDSGSDSDSDSEGDSDEKTFVDSTEPPEKIEDDLSKDSGEGTEDGPSKDKKTHE